MPIFQYMLLRYFMGTYVHDVFHLIRLIRYLAWFASHRILDIYLKASAYNQEMPLAHAIDKSTTALGRNTEHSHWIGGNR